jgi:hypothetical protein
MRNQTLASKSLSFGLPRISYTLEPLQLYNNTFDQMTCENSTDRMRRNLDPAMTKAKGVLDFSTRVETDLKILFMGDSVSVQFSPELQYAAGANPDHRRVIRYSWQTKEGTHVAAPVRGGGAVAGWRIVGFLKRSRMNKPLPNRQGGGWAEGDVDVLLKHSYDGIGGRQKTIGSFDVMTFRIPFGWIHLSDIDVVQMEETVQLANELFGASTVMFIGLHFNNNVLTAEDVVLLKEKNDLIRKFVTEWPSGKYGVNHVLFLDLPSLQDLLLEWNARLIGFNTSDSSYLQEHLAGCCPAMGYKRAIASICSEKVSTREKDCVRNSISVGGTHLCMQPSNLAN